MVRSMYKSIRTRAGETVSRKLRKVYGSGEDSWWQRPAGVEYWLLSGLLIGRRTRKGCKRRRPFISENSIRAPPRQSYRTLLTDETMDCFHPYIYIYIYKNTRAHAALYSLSTLPQPMPIAPASSWDSYSLGLYCTSPHHNIYIVVTPQLPCYPYFWPGPTVRY